MSLNLSEVELDSIREKVIGYRRYLHKHPELSFKEFETADFIAKKLQSIEELSVQRPTPTSVIARLKGRQPGPVRAFRADMDALPIQENNEVPYASVNSGVMHACGHDAHTAMLLTAIETLVQWQDALQGELVFIFQHAEELPPGGAQEIVACGVLEDIDYIIGMHVKSSLTTGVFSLTLGPAMANCGEFALTIEGDGGHASEPHKCIDSILLASEVVTQCHHIVSRRIDPHESAVLSITKINGGTTDNVIPATVDLLGTVRVFNNDLLDDVRQYMEDAIFSITKYYGASYSFEFNNNYEMLVNDEKLSKKAIEIIRDTFGEASFVEGKPEMGGEDFSAYLRQAPGVFINLGTGKTQQGTDNPHHHPCFNIDEEALPQGVRLFCELAFADLQ